MQGGHELHREAKAHMAPAVLQQKNRTPERREAVRRVLQSDLSTAGIVAAVATERATHEQIERQMATVERIADNAVYDQIIGARLTTT